MTIRKQRILVVEDEPELRVIFEWALQKGAYDVQIAQSGRQALRMVEREHFDLILTDLAMPGMSGIELITEIRARADTARTPIVAVTAFGWDRMAAQAKNAGCDGVLQKPIEGKDLRAQVDKYLRNWRFADGFSELK